MLQEEWRVSCFFYNPNLWPEEEYSARRYEAERYVKDLGLEYEDGGRSREAWLHAIKGFEEEKEGGRRCLICYRFRIRTVARMASHRGFDAIATTLTVSPHKNAEMVNKAGSEESAKEGVFFLCADFKKKDGFRKSCSLATEAGLYRQSYCGCEFSMFRDVGNRRLGSKF